MVVDGPFQDKATHRRLGVILELVDHPELREQVGVFRDLADAGHEGA